MFKLSVDNFTYNHAKSFCSSNNLGQRGYADGTPEQQFIGFLTQCVILQEFNLPLPSNSTPDDGKDFIYQGKRIDVKAMGRTVDVRPNFVNNFFQAQEKLNADIFLFCSFHKIHKEITVCGWIPKKDFLAKAILFPKGSIRYKTDGTEFKLKGDNYEISNTKINDVSSIPDLKNALSLYKL